MKSEYLNKVHLKSPRSSCDLQQQLQICESCVQMTIIAREELEDIMILLKQSAAEIILQLPGAAAASRQLVGEE